jgi:hypothetical protein
MTSKTTSQQSATRSFSVLWPRPHRQIYCLSIWFSVKPRILWKGGQLDLQLDIFKTLTSFEALAKFLEEVLTTIGEISRGSAAKNTHQA